MANTDALIRDYIESGVCLRTLASRHGISAATAKKRLNDAGIDTSKRPCFRKETVDLINRINDVLNEYETRLTVRQAFYQVSTRGIVSFDAKGYASVQQAIKKGRLAGIISWDKIEDRTRQPHSAVMWNGIADYMETVLHSYRRNIWLNQPNYFEVWLEKNALYGVVYPTCAKYGVTLQVITGYSSLSTIYDATKRLKSGDTILYLGDHDASGLDIERAISDGFRDDHGIDVNVKRIGLLYEDIEQYDLPPNPMKERDPRTKKYQFDVSAELDAMPPNILVERVNNAIYKHLDQRKWAECLGIEDDELNMIRSSIGDVQGGGDA